MPLSLLHLNIENDRHIERIEPLLRERQPDVVCFQELFAEDVPFFEKILDATCFFVPMMRAVHKERGRLTEGLGIFSKTGFTATDSHQLGGKEGELVDYAGTTIEEKSQTQRYMLAVADVPHEGHTFRIATTHFPVTFEGGEHPIQDAVADRFLSVIDTIGDVVVTGDFNAPRKYPVFTRLSGRLTDNVPQQYETSIYAPLHRNGKIRPNDFDDKMVDGIFSTPGYRVSGVEMICGVSDHCALVGLVDPV